MLVHQMYVRFFLPFILFAFLFPAGDAPARDLRIETVSTVVPFPRGLEFVEGRLYSLSRGRVREYGGAATDLDDMAGRIYEIDLGVSEPFSTEPGAAVRENGRVLAEPTVPPFRLFDRSVARPADDRLTDRPYCTLRWHEGTRSFYICAFSGIDKPTVPGERNFSKNLTDALMRYDLRTGRWHEVERHDVEAGGNYPHHDPAHNPPPHGWLNGPDNCLAVGDWLYAVAKDNSVLVRYDLRAIAADPEAGPPPGLFVMGADVDIAGQGRAYMTGQSMLAWRDGWLYIGYRTSSTILRIPVRADGSIPAPLRAELVARFDPYDPATGKSANLTDMSFDDGGRLLVISASPARVYRFTPDPADVFDARGDAREPWADLAALTGNAKMKCENVSAGPDGHVYVTSGDAYGHSPGLGGAIYRIIAD